MKLTKDEKTGLWYRLYKSDLETIRATYKDYLIDHFTKQDTIFDIGSYIGDFTYRVASQVDWVYAFEPDNMNYRIAIINNRRFSNVTIYNEAVVENDIKKMYLYKTGINDGSNSLYMDGRKIKILVQCVNYHKLVENLKPSIVKCDIEGGEYHLFKKPIAKCIRILIVEFHFRKREWRNLFYEIFDFIQGQGFKVRQMSRLTDQSWHVIINMERI